MSSRYRAYYLATAEAHEATAKAFVLDPTYDGNENTRLDHIKFYLQSAEDYRKMAASQSDEE